MAFRHWMTGMVVVALSAAPVLAQDNKDHHRDARQTQQTEPARREQPRSQAAPQAQPTPQARQNERAAAVPRAVAPREQAQAQRREDAVVRPQVVRPQAVNPQVVRPQAVRPQYVHPQDVHPQYDNRRYDGHYDSGHYAVPRHYVFASPRIIRPTVVQVLPYRPYAYRPSWSIGVYYGTGGYYPYGYTPDGYFNPIPGHYYGGLRITGAPRSAHVFADGYYVGLVDDFDGIFQHMNLEAGPHHIEIQAEGFAPVAFDVNVRPGETITFRADQSFFQSVG